MIDVGRADGTATGNDTGSSTTGGPVMSSVSCSCNVDRTATENDTRSGKRGHETEEEELDEDGCFTRHPNMKKMIFNYDPKPSGGKGQKKMKFD